MERWDWRGTLARAQTLGIDEVIPDREPSGAIAELVLRGCEFAHARGVGMPARLVFVRGGDERKEIARHAPRTDVLSILLDHFFWDDPDANMRDFHRERLFPTARPDFPILHELGHRAHVRAVGDVSRWIAMRGVRLGQAEARILKREVGTNAALDPLEFVADVFVMLVERKSLGEPVMALYRRFGGPPL